MIINQCVILFHSSAKLIANDSDNDESFGSIYQVLNCYAKNKNLIAKIGLLKQFWNMVLIFLSVTLDRNNSIDIVNGL